MKITTRRLEQLFLGLLICQVLVNLVGALGPELGFDALWYHLTEAKLFLQNKSLSPIRGSLLYWSGLPRLAEIIFALALKIWDERLTKIIHWGFGVLSSKLVYKLAKRKYSRLASLAASLLFYTTLLVGWLSTSSYIDLIVTTLILSAIFFKKHYQKAIYLTLLGATKLTAVPYFLAITWIPWTVLGAIPFFLINFKSTGNPVYPFLENFSLTGEYFLNGFWFWFLRPLRLFIDPSFRVGPAILLLLLFFKNKINWHYLKRPLLVIFFLWWFGPGTGFGRFALPFLALISVALASVFNKKPTRFAIFLVLLQASIGITGRFWANKKYLPVIFKTQSKADFLTQNLKFHFGDFYDIDGWFQNNIKSTDKVLIYNIHNLYYIDFPYDHHTWADPGTNYTHVLMGDSSKLPEKYANLPLIYKNSTTGVKLYKLP